MNQKELINEISVILQKHDIKKKVADDIGFHITDWYDNLEELHLCIKDIKSYDSEKVYQIITDFLIHAPSHIAAASKLMTGDPVTDVFEVGAVKERR